MVSLKKLSGVMEHPTVYQLWQAPFAGSKFDPVLRHNDINSIHRVLDVGCGPGTNAPWFRYNDYLGLDINPHYIQMARQKYGRPFDVADVCEYQADPNSKFDFVLLNSLLHHIDTDHVYKILRQLSQQLTPDGHIHILDLVLPESKSIARSLALGDRGDWPRPLKQWETIFQECFEPVLIEPYPIRVCGVTLWNMVYFKGRIKG